MTTDVWSSAEDGEGQGKEEGSGAWVGIDFGTSNSCVALWHPQKHRAKIVKNAHGLRTTPSVGFMRSQDDILVGKDAVDAWTQKGERGAVIPSVKRIMGRRIADQEVSNLAASLPYRLTEPKAGEVLIEATTTGGAVLTKKPEEVAGLILKSLRASAEAYLAAKPFPGVPPTVDRAVIAVPAHFNEAQKAATRAAAKLAGFKRVALLTEPFAAAMAYGLFVAGEKMILTFDMGGGTTDICVMRLEDGRFEVLATEGDNELGGEDMDFVLFEHVVRSQGKDPCAVPPSLRAELLHECMDAKVLLSIEDSAKVDVSRLTGAPDGSVEVEVTRDTLERLIAPLVQRAKARVEMALAAAELSPSAIQEVVLVGGCSRVPAISDMLHAVFGEGLELCTAINPDEAVAEGAAIRAAILSGVDPAILRDVLMLDVVPLSIGVETADGRFEVLLPKNERIPCLSTKYFEVAVEQKIVRLELREGESEEAEENTLIATVDLPIWHHMTRHAGGAPGDADGYDNDDKDRGLVPVTVEMDAEGRLKVSLGDPAKEEAEGSAVVGAYTVPLVCYIIILFMLYLGLKVYFTVIHFNDELLSQVTSPSGEL